MGIILHPTPPEDACYLFHKQVHTQAIWLMNRAKDKVN